ncbi:MAG: TraR/DksA C4-type zinc finger protein [Desulfomicrobium sp.]|nr:TraR/DksA C4-type zinc finger protein [Desulfomicrobium sp.]
MADYADIAAAREAEIRADALAARKSSPVTTASATECEECGDPIPERRRQAVPGCTRCVACQDEKERIHCG